MCNFTPIQLAKPPVAVARGKEVARQGPPHAAGSGQVVTATRRCLRRRADSGRRRSWAPSSAGVPLALITAVEDGGPSGLREPCLTSARVHLRRPTAGQRPGPRQPVFLARVSSLLLACNLSVALALF